MVRARIQTQCSDPKFYVLSTVPSPWREGSGNDLRANIRDLTMVGMLSLKQENINIKPPAACLKYLWNISFITFIWRKISCRLIQFLKKCYFNIIITLQFIHLKISILTLWTSTFVLHCSPTLAPLKIKLISTVLSYLWVPSHCIIFQEYPKHIKPYIYFMSWVLLLLLSWSGRVYADGRYSVYFLRVNTIRSSYISTFLCKYNKVSKWLTQVWIYRDAQVNGTYISVVKLTLEYCPKVSRNMQYISLKLVKYQPGTFNHNQEMWSLTSWSKKVTVTPVL